MKIFSATLLGVMLCLPAIASADNDQRGNRGHSGYSQDDRGRHGGYDKHKRNHKQKYRHGQRWAPPRNYAKKRHYKRGYWYPRPIYRPGYKPVYRYPYRPNLRGAATFSYYDPYSGAISISIPID